MEIKHYKRAWLPGFKGALFIILGIIAMLQVTGTIKTLAVFFSALIIMIGLLLVSSTILFGRYKYPLWTIITGLIHLVIAVILIVKIDQPRETVLSIMMVWIIYNALTEFGECILLVINKNSLAAVFFENALLSLLLGLSIYGMLGDITAERVFNLGFVAVVFGLVSLASAYLLSTVKEDKKAV
jgi:hypothetical protein